MKNYKYILTHTSGNLTVVYNPVGWNNFNLVLARSKKYHSVLRSQVIDSEFPRDGKAYIDNIYANYGIDTDIGCEVQYLDKSDTTYKTLFEGIIDLSEWNKLRDTTIVKIADDSVLSRFIARDDIQIPINRLLDLDGNAVDVYTYLNTMKVEGVDIESRALWEDANNSINVTSGENSPFTDWFGVTADSFDVNDIGADATLPAVSLGSANGPIYTNNSGGSITVRFRVVTRIVGQVQVVSGGGWAWSIKAQTGKNGSTAAISISESGSGGDITGFDESYDSGYITATLTNGETIEIYHEWQGSGTFTAMTPGFIIEPTFVDVFEVIDAKAATDIEMPLLHEIGAKLLEIMTGQSDPLNAPVLGRTDSEPRDYGGDGIYSLSGVASGNMLREKLFAEFPLTTSFTDYFKTLDALYNLGLWYDKDESEFVIGLKAAFYKVEKIITLGEVKDLEVTIAQDEYFNKIVTGYSEKLDYEDVNGTQVFNVPGEFANDGKRIKNTKDLQSVYHGDDYGIELARKNADDIDSVQDSRYDKQQFIITGQRDGGDYETLQGFDDFTDIDNVYSPATRLNLNITPKRNLNRNLNILSIPLFITEGDTYFMTNQFELALETKKSGDPTVVEKDDFAYSDLAQPLYYPEIYNFNAPLTNDDVLQLLDDPHGYVEFDYLGTTYSGYIIQVSTEPFNNRGNWTLVKRNPNR